MPLDPGLVMFVGFVWENAEHFMLCVYSGGKGSQGEHLLPPLSPNKFFDEGNISATVTKIGY